MTATKEQMQHIQYLLNGAEIYNTTCFDHEREDECGLPVERKDAIYIDGDVTFDLMAEIVDYLRK